MKWREFTQRLGHSKVPIKIVRTFFIRKYQAFIIFVQNTACLRRNNKT